MKEKRKEIRAFPIEMRKAEDGALVLAGMPIVYNRRSEDLGFYEYVDRGAATKALKKSDVRGLYGHNSDSLLPLGRQSAKTLTLKENEEGVSIRIDPPKKNPFVDALIESIERGDIREMSFGFIVAKGGDNWTYPQDGSPAIRHITEIEELFDVSYVAFAAYNDTSVALRSLEKFKTDNPLTIDAGPSDPLAGLMLLKEEDELYMQTIEN